MPRPTKKQLLLDANKRFQGRWMAAEDLSYIFPVSKVSFPGNLPDDPSDLQRLPLAIHAGLFIDSADDFVKVDEIVETWHHTIFYDNPYYVESHPDARGIMFISRKQARDFIRKVRKKLADQIDLLDTLTGSSGKR